MPSGNPICNTGNNEQYCKIKGQSSNPDAPPYATKKNCSGLPSECLSSQLLSPSCVCAVPYKGILSLRAPSFSDLSNESYYLLLENDMKTKLLSFKAPVDSIALQNPFFDATNYLRLRMSLEVFPNGKIQFGEQDISDTGFLLSSQTYKPPHIFGPFYFNAQSYPFARGKIIDGKATLSTICHFTSGKIRIFLRFFISIIG